MENKNLLLIGALTGLFTYKVYSDLKKFKTIEKLFYISNKRKNGKSKKNIRRGK